MATVQDFVNISALIVVLCGTLIFAPLLLYSIWLFFLLLLPAISSPAVFFAVVISGVGSLRSPRRIVASAGGLLIEFPFGTRRLLTWDNLQIYTASPQKLEVGPWAGSFKRYRFTTDIAELDALSRLVLQATTSARTLNPRECVSDERQSAPMIANHGILPASISLLFLIPSAALALVSFLSATQDGARQQSLNYEFNEFIADPTNLTRSEIQAVEDISSNCVTCYMTIPVPRAREESQTICCTLKIHPGWNLLGLGKTPNNVRLHRVDEETIQVYATPVSPTTADTYLRFVLVGPLFTPLGVNKKDWPSVTETNFRLRRLRLYRWELHHLGHSPSQSG